MLIIAISFTVVPKTLVMVSNIDKLRKWIKPINHVNHVWFEQAHQKPMVMCDGCHFKLPLGRPCASSAPLKQHAIIGTYVMGLLKSNSFLSLMKIFTELCTWGIILFLPSNSIIKANRELIKKLLSRYQIIRRQNMRIYHLIPYHAANMINYLIAIYLSFIQSETCRLM